MNQPIQNFWNPEDVQCVCYPITIVANKAEYKFPDKSILACNNACLIAIAIRDYDADRVSINGNALVSSAFIKKSFLKLNDATTHTFFQDLPLEWAIGSQEYGRENFTGLRLPTHGVDLTNSGFRMAGNISVITDNVGKDVEFWYFYIDGNKYPQQLGLG
jgi:hypothetical protein